MFAADQEGFAGREIETSLFDLGVMAGETFGLEQGDRVAGRCL
jgi:hypothetical protein